MYACEIEKKQEKHYLKYTALFQFLKIFLVCGKLGKVKKSCIHKKCIFIIIIC